LLLQFSQGTQVKAWSVYPEGGFSTSQRDYVHMPPVEASFSDDKQYLSMAAGMYPSPDWYTGFYTFWLVDEYTRTWYDHIKIQTKPWDAGTDLGITYLSTNSDEDPANIVQRVVPSKAPAGGELLNSAGDDVNTVGELECYLVAGDADLILPDCDWFTNPCCNETSADCQLSFFDGMSPNISSAYEEVMDARGSSSANVSTSHILGMVLAVALVMATIVY
jgi:hypothetical protein